MISTCLRGIVMIFFSVPLFAEAEFNAPGLAKIDDAILQAITDAKAPGGVFRMEREGTVYQKAYGDRAILPDREAMTEDTIFDAASLTKVLATTPAVMKLAETGRLDLEKTLSHYIPEFLGEGKEAITIRQLLTHTSGLRAGLGGGLDRKRWRSESRFRREALRQARRGLPLQRYQFHPARTARRARL